VKSRLRDQYEREIVPALMKKYSYKNVMQVPKIDKVVVNMGVGDAIQEPRYLEKAIAELAVITGQKPAHRRAKKSISNFKLREGLKIACQVTLRGDRMYEFMDRLFNMAMPRIRDFRGVPRKSFDQFGNYTLGLKEQTIFPELNMDTVERVRGMNITFVIKNAKTKDEGFDVLDQLGMPFQRQN
jgi:large subunit ribosomal protein L5